MKGKHTKICAVLNVCSRKVSGVFLVRVMLDSQADFRARAREIGFDEPELSNLDRLGYNTFGRLAFAANYVPGASDDSPLLQLGADITGTDPAPANRMPLVRRLVFESYTLASADLRSKIERKDEDTPRRMAQAERAARHDEQKRRLNGLDLTGELEPSNALIDAVYQLHEDNALKYIRWETCTKRDQELMGLKTDPVWKPDANGVVREQKVLEVLKADVGSDLKLQYALQRRSLAFDQARLVNYDKFEKWTQVLMQAYMAPPPDNYLRVTLEQIHRADLELFKYMMKETRSGIRPQSGTAPLETALEKALVAPEVRLSLQPLQGGKRKLDGQESNEADKKSKSSSSNEVEKLRKQLENVQGQLRNIRNSDLGAGKKGKGKGKSKSIIRMPSALIGLSPVNGSNEPICFDYNLKGCSKAKPGEKCPKGWHSCMHHNCFLPHSQKDHK